MQLSIVFIPLKVAVYKDFSSLHVAYKQGRLKFFCFFTLSKGIDDAQLFIGYVLSTKLFFPIGYSSASRALSVVGYVFTTNSPFAFHSFQHNVHIRHRRDNDEHKTVVVVKHHYQGCQLTVTLEYANASQRLRQPMFKCGLQSMAACINYTISCGLQSSEFGKRIIYYRKQQMSRLWLH